MDRPDTRRGGPGGKDAEQDAEKNGAPGQLSTGKTVEAILMAASGNLVEWFDFYAYAFFSVYFAEQFFPRGGQTVAFMEAAGVFFIGFLMRPIGGYVFGRMADRFGRKRAMVASILLMGAGSLAMALLPTAATVGLLAPALLIVVRCVQGMAVGGEYGSVATYMSEIAQKGRRGFYSSFHYVTLIGGQLLASFIAVVMTHTLGDDRITAGWWRLPFVIGALLALISLWLREGLLETTTAADRGHARSGSLGEVFRHPRSVVIVFGITIIGSLSFYVFTTYMQKYLIDTVGFAKGAVADVMAACLFLFLLMQPVVGMLSDRIGRKTTIIIFTGSMIVLPVPLLAAIGRQTALLPAALLILVAMVFLSFYTSISGVVKAEVWPAYIRGLGLSFTYAIGNSLFGGSAEYIALFLKNAGHPTVFPWYMVVVAILGFAAILVMYDDRKESTLDFPETSAYGQ